MENFTFSGVMAATLFGTLGFWIVKEAKKKTNIPLALTGAAMIIYPFFTKSSLADWGIGILLASLARYLWSR